MAWTAPMTAVANTAFTAAQFNTFVRDNLLETAPAKATTAGGWFASTGLNEIAERHGAAASTLVNEQTTSTAFTDLPTVGPQVTVETGVSALVIVNGSVSNSGGGSARMSYEVSGASTYSGADNRGSAILGAAGAAVISACAVLHLPGNLPLTPGSNTFTAKYRVSSGTGTFTSRRILVMPF